MRRDDLVIALFLLGALSTGVGQAATARGPARAYRGEAKRRRAGIQAQIGGEEEMFEAHAKKVELALKVKELAKKGAEFVFDSKEKVDAVFRCTACKKAVGILGKDIVGRLKIGRERQQEGRKKKKKKKKKKRTATRGKIRKHIRALIEGVCARSEITKDQNTAGQCPLFIQASAGSIEDMFLDHCDPEGEYFEDDIDTEEVCRSVVLTDAGTCAPGVKSMDELLAGRINADAEEKRQKERAVLLDKQREGRRRTRMEEDRKVVARLKKKTTTTKKKKKKKKKTKKKKKKEEEEEDLEDLEEEEDVEMLTNKEREDSKGDKRGTAKRTRTVIRKVRRVRRVLRRQQQPHGSAVAEGEL
jgi:hypothetical protein